MEISYVPIFKIDVKQIYASGQRYALPNISGLCRVLALRRFSPSLPTRAGLSSLPFPTFVFGGEERLSFPSEDCALYSAG